MRLKFFSIIDNRIISILSILINLVADCMNFVEVADVVNKSFTDMLYMEKSCKKQRHSFSLINPRKSIFHLSFFSSINCIVCNRSE